jgi:hypothetical protein
VEKWQSENDTICHGSLKKKKKKSSVSQLIFKFQNRS